MDNVSEQSTSQSNPNLYVWETLYVNKRLAGYKDSTGNRTSEAPHTLRELYPDGTFFTWVWYGNERDPPPKVLQFPRVLLWEKPRAEAKRTQKRFQVGRVTLLCIFSCVPTCMEEWHHLRANLPQSGRKFRNGNLELANRYADWFAV